MTNLKGMAKYFTKLAAYRNRKIFLLECKKKELIPKHIQQYVDKMHTSIEADDPRTMSSLHRKGERLARILLNLNIDNCHIKINNLENGFTECKNC